VTVMAGSLTATYTSSYSNNVNAGTAAKLYWPW
jgi:hypothetical protein